MLFQDVEKYVGYVAGKFKLFGFQIFEIIQAYNSMLTPHQIADVVKLDLDVVQGILDLLYELKAIEIKKKDAMEYLSSRNMFRAMEELEVIGSVEEIEEFMRKVGSKPQYTNRKLNAYDIIGFKNVVTAIFSNREEYITTLKQELTLPQNVNNYKIRYTTYREVPDEVFIPWNRGFKEEEIDLIITEYLVEIIGQIVEKDIDSLEGIIKAKYTNVNGYLKHIPMETLSSVLQNKNEAYFYIEELDYKRIILELFDKNGLSIRNLTPKLQSIVLTAIEDSYNFPLIQNYIDEIVDKFLNYYNELILTDLIWKLRRMVSKSTTGPILALLSYKDGVSFMVYDKNVKSQGYWDSEEDFHRGMMKLYWNYKFVSINAKGSFYTESRKRDINKFQNKLKEFGKTQVKIYREVEFELMVEDKTNELLVLCEVFKNINPVNALTKVNPLSLLGDYGKHLETTVFELYREELKRMIKEYGVDINTSTESTLALTNIPSHIITALRENRPFNSKEDILKVVRENTRYLTTKKGTTGDRLCLEPGEEYTAFEDVYKKYVRDRGD